MERDYKRSQTRERFPPIAPGRTFLSASNESVDPGRTYIIKPCPPPPDSVKRQRPISGRSSTSLNEEIKRLRPGSGHSTSYGVEEIKRQKSNTAHALNCAIEEMKRNRPDKCQYLTAAEIRQQRYDSGRCLAYIEGEEIKRQRPDSGRYVNPAVERIKRQKSINAHSLSSVMEVAESQSSTSSIALATPAEVPDATTTYGHVNTASEFDDKAAISTSRMEILQEQAVREEIREEEKRKSFSAQQFRNVYSPTPDLNANSSDVAANRAPTPVVVDAKAERKRRRREKKERERERETKKVEEARRKEQEKIDAERMVAEISRNRSMFNGNKDTLPAIGSKTAEVNFYIGKLPKIKEHDLLAPTLPENNAVDVIRKHETQVRTTAFLREISQDYMNASAELMEPFRKNEAIEIIERHEDEFGRTYVSDFLIAKSFGSSDKPSSAKSRRSPGASRWGAL